ncbi:UDP-galactopyranose mutase [Pedobacter chinensis]|uniref:UDP-galactopyranose mutase n=1 Tax=Pedobacter chinensis TaxID=2282421 RepID=A0A369PXW2_9SPHI|nr:UDP-galactopyranose mutase [Pedobacter chinensis]RDC55827.1 UDP-galactopyranose mutase [Pedobacter chinensis]
MNKYDYLIVGSGLFGAVFAHEAHKRGKKCLVIDKRNHQGGNVHCEKIEGINVHKYGPHIFHTNDKELWDYVNSFVEFNNFVLTPLAKYQDRLYNLPFNMNTFYQLWNVQTPAKAKEKIQSQVVNPINGEAANLEEQALSLVGTDVYQKLIKGYTEKQWGRKATELPAFIIKRLPVRFTFDNNYFNDRYQGIPVGGYNKLMDGLLNGIEVRLEQDYFADRGHWDSVAEHTVFTGKIDQYYDFRFGQLEYRSLRFETEILDTDNFQGNAVINYTEREVPYTRVIEHKHFEHGKQEKTVVTKEYSQEWSAEKEPYYPINDEKNDQIFRQYQQLARNQPEVIFGGRLAEYRYYDMHQVIASALKKVSDHFIDLDVTHLSLTTSSPLN